MKKKVIKFIEDFYSIEAEFLWADTPNFSIFRNKRNKKWFCVLMEQLPKNKFGFIGEDRVDVINIKIDPMMKTLVMDSVGIHPAYHMNKEHWISVFLDKSVKFSNIKQLITLSYDLIDEK